MIRFLRENKKLALFQIRWSNEIFYTDKLSRQGIRYTTVTKKTHVIYVELYLYILATVRNNCHRNISNGFAGL